ncbi:MAG: shikimate dehydrogenase [Proteobacteria bacterium]|nr:shikimate dehydrogenase [Pseudomonadota bacterium]
MMIKAALIGNPVCHSLSPRLHNFWCEKYRISGNYEAISLEEKDLDSFLGRIRSGEFVGANVTAPFKEKLLEKMDCLEKAAEKTGAINTIISRKDGTLEGRNSDPSGFMENLMSRAPRLNIQNITTMVLGTGGAARACIFALLDKGAGKIIVAGRTESHLRGLMNFFSNSILRDISWSGINTSGKGVSLLVNATSSDLSGAGALQFDFSTLAQDSIVYDLVYNPPETEFLKAARKTGLKTIDGLGMLIYQAIPAFEAWFGVRPDYDNKIYDMLKQREI